MKSKALSTLAAILSVYICVCASPLALAQKGVEKVIYTFQGGSDGQYPWAGLIADRDGNLYGTTLDVFSPTCSSQCGTVYRLSPPATSGSPWTKSELYVFHGGDTDGATPYASLTMDKNGNLFGTTRLGGPGSGGTVFELSPPKSPGEAWTEEVLMLFPADGSLGLNPWGGLTFDADGNLYGTTLQGGSTVCHCGTVFELTPPTTAGKNWTLTTIHRFGGSPNDVDHPYENLIFDRSGALYGVTAGGGGYDVGGAVFQMKRHNGTWSEKVLHSFLLDNYQFADPEGTPVLDSTGNLYGIGNEGSSYAFCDCGGIWELSPGDTGLEPWTYNVLYQFYVPSDADQKDGSNPLGGLLMDKAGNLYGTAGGGLDRKNEEHDGIIFELSPPTTAGGTWTKTVLHEFAGAKFGDGRYPIGSLIMVKGKFYGVTVDGGSADFGTVYSLTVTP